MVAPKRVKSVHCVAIGLSQYQHRDERYNNAFDHDSAFLYFGAILDVYLAISCVLCTRMFDASIGQFQLSFQFPLF